MASLPKQKPKPKVADKHKILQSMNSQIENLREQFESEAVQLALGSNHRQLELMDQRSTLQAVQHSKSNLPRDHVHAREVTNFLDRIKLLLQNELKSHISKTTVTSSQLEAKLTQRLEKLEEQIDFQHTSNRDIELQLGQCRSFSADSSAKLEAKLLERLVQFEAGVDAQKRLPSQVDTSAELEAKLLERLAQLEAEVNAQKRVPLQVDTCSELEAKLPERLAKLEAELDAQTRASLQVDTCSELEAKMSERFTKLEAELNAHKQPHLQADTCSELEAKLSERFTKLEAELDAHKQPHLQADSSSELEAKLSERFTTLEAELTAHNQLHLEAKLSVGLSKADTSAELEAKLSQRLAKFEAEQLDSHKMLDLKWDNSAKLEAELSERLTKFEAELDAHKMLHSKWELRGIELNEANDGLCMSVQDLQQELQAHSLHTAATIQEEVVSHVGQVSAKTDWLWQDSLTAHSRMKEHEVRLDSLAARFEACDHWQRSLANKVETADLDAHASLVQTSRVAEIVRELADGLQESPTLVHIRRQLAEITSCAALLNLPPPPHGDVEFSPFLQIQGNLQTGGGSGHAMVGNDWLSAAAACQGQVSSSASTTPPKQTIENAEPRACYGGSTLGTRWITSDDGSWRDLGNLYDSSRFNRSSEADDQ